MSERDNRLVPVLERLARVTNGRDLSPVLEPAALDEARRLTDLLSDHDTDIESRHALAWFHWYRFHALPKGLDDADLDAAIGMFTACFIVGVPDLPDPLLEQLADIAVSGAVDMLNKAFTQLDPGLVEATVGLWHRIVSATPADHPGLAQRLGNLGLALQTRYQRLGDAADVNDAVRRGQQAVDLTPSDQPERAIMLSNLGLALQARYEHAGSAADLDAAVDVSSEAVELSPAGDPYRSVRLNNLGIALRLRAERAGHRSDLDTALSVLREAYATTPTVSPHRAGILSNVSLVQRMRYEHTEDLAALEEAITHGRGGLRTTPDGHPDVGTRLGNLSCALRLRYEHMGDLSDLDEAIGLGQEALRATSAAHTTRPDALTHLGNALSLRHEHAGNPADLERAIDLLQEAFDTTPRHPGRDKELTNLATALWKRFERSDSQADLDRAVVLHRQAAQGTGPGNNADPVCLSNLGMTLAARFERTGNMRDLDEAIDALRRSVEDRSTDGPRRASALSNLGTALRVRSEHTGSAGDLDEAIRLLHKAVRHTGDKAGQASHLSNLGLALQYRFERDGSLADLHEAVRAGQEAVRSTSPAHPSAARHLSNVAGALWARFQRLADRADLDEALDVLRQSLEATAGDDPYRPGRATNLAVTLETRFNLTAHHQDLDEAVSLLLQAARDTPRSHPGLPTQLNNLASGLWARFQRDGAAADLDAAIEREQQAAELIPEDHPDRVVLLGNLGRLLTDRFEHFGNASDRDAAAAAFTDAWQTSTAPPSNRIKAARAAAHLIARSEPEQACDLLEAAVRLLPEVAPRQLSRSDQQFAIGGCAGLAAEAAALAMASTRTTDTERAARALQLLEAGRAVLLSQVFNARNDVTDLQRRYPQLATRFTELRDLLDRSAQQDLDGPARPDTGVNARPSLPPAERHECARVFATTLAEIRSLEGFESFGLPPAVAELIAEAEPGPVVVFNVSSHRSDALLLTSGGITALALPDLDIDTLVEHVDTFHTALTETVEGATSDARRRAQAELVATLQWLWDAAAGPVLEALGFHEQPADGTAWPAMWWVPGGLLGLLPLHAAGYLSDTADDPHRRTVMDRVISSFAPSVRALRYARGRSLPPDPNSRGLIVAMPTTPGLDGDGHLDFVDEEASVVKDHVADHVFLREPDPSAEQTVPATPHTPTKETVLEHLPSCRLVHFACHGVSDPSDPSRSRLLLHDHTKDPLTVASLSPVNLRHAQLAYLSACRTASIDQAELIDEAIHLTSAFQLAGFPHVIGTLWEIDDEIAVRVTREFYSGLRTDQNVLDTRRTAQSLHSAVRTIRDRLPRTPYLWAGYLHVGA